MKDISEIIGDYVSARISVIAKDEKALESSGSKARLARLRRGIGKKPGEIPELWGDFLQDLPEELTGRYLEPTREEWAVYTALTLFALHQQGNSELMNASGREYGLGRAVSRLIADPSDEDEVERISFKLSLAALSDDMTELSYRLKSIVRLLSHDGIKLDYAELAKDIYFFRSGKADNVRLKWGREFYCGLNADERKDSKNEE